MNWWSRRAQSSRWQPLREWANQHGAAWRHSAEGEGWQMNLGPQGSLSQRWVDWGRSQRPYVSGHELRMRFDAGLHPELQLMLMDRSLMERLEESMFDAFTDSLQTRVDTQTPEEMRWLVMFPKLQPLSRVLRTRVALLGVTRELAQSWLEGRLSDALAQACVDVLPEPQAFVLMVHRGRAYLRLPCEQPTPQLVQALVRLLVIAAEEAQRVNPAVGDGGPWSQSPSTGFSIPPDDPGSG